MKKKLAIVFGVIVFMLFSLTACGNSSEKTQSTDDSATTVMFTDSAGREVELPKNINRIVSTGPLSQIILFALAPDDLVAINDEWNEKNKPYIDAGYYDLPVLGSVFGGADLNVEQLVATNPQVIIDIGEAKDSIKKDMEDLQVQTGIPVIHIDATINTMGDTFKTLGKLLNCKSQGEKLASYCETTNKSTLAIIDKVGAENKTKVLYCLGSDGLSVMAENSYHSEILNLVANNVAKVDNPASKGTGTAINMEQLMIWDPDVILFAPDSIYDTVSSDSNWQDLKAIKTRNYYEVPDGPYNWMGFPPSVQRYLGMMWMTDLFYPDKVDYNLYKEISNFYKLFYHYDLSQSQFDKLMENSHRNISE